MDIGLGVRADHHEREAEKLTGVPRPTVKVRLPNLSSGDCLRAMDRAGGLGMAYRLSRGNGSDLQFALEGSI